MTMNKREEIISLWFEMWLQKKDLGILRYFRIMLHILKVGGRDMIVLKN